MTDTTESRGKLGSWAANVIVFVVGLTLSAPFLLMAAAPLVFEW